MNILQGTLIRLAAVDADKDPAVLARWSYNTEFWRLLDSDPVTPARAQTIREFMNKSEPERFIFHLRALTDDRLIGLIGLSPFWTHRDAWLFIGIGEPEYWGRGYGSDALRAALRYAFHELNLERVTLGVFDYNVRARRAYEKLGFVYEGVERGLLQRENARSGMTAMGILRSEWEEQDGGRRTVDGRAATS
jgi:RimJ/RimL family protein N-acetyltransferase